MALFVRETATHEQDLPHPFTGSARGTCTICKCGLPDARHEAFEQAMQTPVEPSDPFVREVGS